MTLTVGGNDLGFVPTLTSCLFMTDSECSAYLQSKVGAALNQLPASLDALYTSIRQKAPAADVQVVGYPRLFDLTGNCEQSGNWSIAKRTAINAIADQLAGMMHRLADSRGFTFVDIRDTFNGHGVCGGAPWINGPVYNNLAESFHPTANGQAVIASVIRFRNPMANASVDATSDSVSTGIRVAVGDKVSVTAGGSVLYGWEGQPECSGRPELDADGNRTLGAGHLCTPKLDGWSSRADLPVGTLIGRVGNGPWIKIGKSATFTADAAGELVLRVNDSNSTDNSGAFEAQITTQAAPVTSTP